MTTTNSIVPLLDGVIGVTVPNNAYDYKVATDNKGINRLWYKLPIIRGMPQIELPEGKWELIGKASELTEDQWSKVIKPIDTSWEENLDYLKSKNLDPSTTLILRNNQP